jgi:YVTN family beta-propeller protein
MIKYIGFLVVFSIVLMKVSTLHAQQKEIYKLDKKITLPGDGGYDYLFIDQENRRLYVSHGTSVHIINLDTDQLVGTIEGMQGNHGTAVVTELGKGFISDGKANAVVVFDMNTLKTIKVIPLSGKKPDAIIYDPYSKYIFAFNGSSDNVSVVDATELKEINTIAAGGGPEFAVADGHGKIYNNIEDKNMLNVIDSKNMKLINSYPLAPCGGPTGLALDAANNRIFTACRENKGLSVLDISSGKIITTIPIGAGVDAVVYDAENKLIICSNGDGTATVIKQQSANEYSVVQTLSTQYRAKTMALDKKTHQLYFSVADFDASKKNMLPGTFKVLVFKLAE